MTTGRTALAMIGLGYGALLLSACSNPGYNDNPSQQRSDGRVGCLAATEFFAVYFNVHIQPFGDRPDERITKEVFRSYCEEIPLPGRVYFTADLVGPELRKTPLALRVAEQEFAGYGFSLTPAYRDLRSLLEVPAAIYAKGVVESRFELEHDGHYAVYLTRGGEEAATDNDRLRIPLIVGEDPMAPRLLPRLLAGIALVAAAAAAVRFLRRRRTR